MEPLHIDDTPLLREVLMEQARWLVSEREVPPGTISRAQVPIAGIDIMTWFRAQPPGSRGYWSDRSGEFELAGVGKADMLSSGTLQDIGKLFDQLDERVRQAQGNIRYFGGCRFIDSEEDGPWAPFTACRFILPRFEVCCSGAATTFAINMKSGETLETLEQELAQVVFPEPAPPPALPVAKRRTDSPSHTEWSGAVGEVLGSFERGECEKIVLAREVTLAFDETPDAASLLAHLRKATTSSCHFCFQPRADAAFVGASPELLYRREGNRISTEAIAGTRPRGATPFEDSDLHEELLTSNKEGREQQYVADAVDAALQDLCRSYQGDRSPSVLSLASTHHLITRFDGELNPGVRDAEILQRLHPTPAVGGHPTDVALQAIARLEPFDRGWYAGPVGWYSRDAAQFAVGIRSALIRPNEARLYSGAGIVAGSTPQDEWDEVENKIRDFLTLLCRTE